MKLSPALRAAEQQLLFEVSGPKMMEYTAGIARWERLSGTPEERESFRYVQQLLNSFGVSTRLLEHDAYISLPGPARIELPEGPGPACYTTSFGVTTPPEGVEGELVYCGNGTPADYAGKDVRGKIVLLDGLPAAPKGVAAEAAGAAGQINIAADHLHWMIVSPVWGNPTPDRLNRYPTHPITCITKQAGAELKARLQKGPLRVCLHTQVDTGWRKTPLLIAEIKGRSDDFVLFSGHLDSWAYGAMDNGTANATMIECARLMAQRRGQLRRSVRFAFWSGHSHGRYSGSAWYADNHWEELHNHCVCHLNIDSVGAKTATVLTEAIIMPETKDLARAVIHEQTGIEFEGRRVGRMGDQSFLGIGVPSMFMSLSEQAPSEDETSKAMSLRLGGKPSGGLGWWWHTTEDTMDKIDEAYLVRDARIYAAVLWRLLTLPVLPLNVQAAAEEWVGHLEGLQKAAGDRFDISVARERATKLADLAAEVQHIADSTAAGLASAPDDAGLQAKAAELNRTLLAIERCLIPPNYSAGSPFDHDPALPTPALPGLDPVRRLASMEPESDEVKFLLTQLGRSRNRVNYALLKAMETAVHSLARLR